MTKDELNSIAESIKRTNTQNDTITLRDILSAFGRVSRTAPAIRIVNNWMLANNLKSVVEINSYTALDQPLQIQFKYTIKHAHFQLYSLTVKNWRNLNDFSINFENSDNYCTLIGLNGSGKSNVIEAICEIFHHLYNGTVCPFRYDLHYIMDGQYFEIRNGKINSQPVEHTQLPRNIVASYSGEDNRMWKGHFWPLYQEYCKDIANMPNIAVPQMLAVGRKQWNIAFLTLLYARKNNLAVDDFLKSIIQTSECQIRLKYNEDNLKVWKETTGKHFVNSLKSKDVYSVEEFSSSVDGLEYVDSPSTLFNLLYQATAERGNNPISDIDIVIDGHGSLNSLSEGEKKMIVVITIMEILSTERSLCLFDEPDSHVHVSRKREMLNLIDTANRYSVLTTHSPMFIDDEKEGNIRFMNNGKVEDSSKLKWIKDLSSGSISYIDAAFVVGAKRKILLTEGTYDKLYIEKAIHILSTDDNNFIQLKQKVFIVKCGGTGSAISTYQELIEPHIDDVDKVAFLFDYDKAGVDAYKKVKDLIHKNPRLNGKLIPLFYQSDYSTEWSYTTEPKKGDSDYMVEDVFPKESYASIVEDHRKYETHKDFRKHDENIQASIKTYIEKHYWRGDFKNEWFNGFTHILENLLKIFELN